MDRGSCWSITINNPTEEDTKTIKNLTNYGWFKEFKSQVEQGDNGTPHIQGMLKTTQQRFTTIKRAIPRAHIELARNATALAKYVEKSDTRLEARDTVVRDIPTLFEYQDKVARELTIKSILDYHSQMIDKREFISMGDAALHEVDRVVGQHICAGGRGLEYIGINPMWRSSWKKFWRSIIERNGIPQASEASQQETRAETPPQCEQIRWISVSDENADST